MAVIAMFVGRKRELEILDEAYKGEKFECAVIYGRRRVGKTTLIQEFIRDKKAIYFLSLETSEQINLINLGKCIYNAGFDGIKTPPRFTDFTDALDMIGDLAVEERIVMVIDEYPYLAESVKGISSMLQAQIDMRYLSTKLFLILCGSSMSFMENQVLGYKSPLYGRRTSQFNIQPFTFVESISFHKEFSLNDSAVVYAITGGIPQYLSKINGKKTLKQNIINCYFDPSSYLFEEPSNLLKQELREPAMYNNVITAIAAGSSRLNEIATKTGLATAVCSKYLTSLISLGIVKKECPVFAKGTKKTIYRLADGMFRFWYRFVPQNIAQIQSGASDRIYDSIKQQIPDYMGEVFEEICKQWLWHENISERLPFYFSDAGRWWGTNPIKKCEQEIDIIAFEETGKKAIFCECKWQNEKMPESIIDEIIDKSAMFNFAEKYYYLFSKSGFTDAAKKRADSRIVLIELKDMF